MANPLRNLGAGLLRGMTADVLGMPVDTLNMLRQAMASPAAGGNPYARKIAGLLGPVMETGTSDYFAQQMGLPQGQGLLYEGARMVSPSPTDLMSMARRVPIQELITYHGTPHRFEPTPANPLGEFEAAKIGTGEGAQAYGHGVYLAEDPSVANQYRVNLSYDPEQMRIGNRQINDVYDSIQNAAARMPVDKANSEYEKLELLEKLMMNERISDVQSRAAEMSPATRKWFEKEVAPSFKTYGSLYTADLPDEMIDRMLDWDKPINKQSKYVKDALEAAGIDPMSSDQAGPMARGQELLLQKFGIPGIKYFDEGSRDKGKGTRNFVVFPGEEKKVKILKRE